MNNLASYRISLLSVNVFIFNFDLQRALESFQLKTAVERTTMNDIHMQTIKVGQQLMISLFCNLQYIIFL